MRRLVSTSILFAVWVAATRGVSTPTVASCSLTRTTFRGWQAYRLSNGLVKLTVTPDIGGRAIQYELGSHSYFFVNPELAGGGPPPERNNRRPPPGHHRGVEDLVGPPAGARGH